MIARALLVVMLAFPAIAAMRLRIGPEVEIGRPDLVVPQPTYTRSAVATDGETIFVVHGAFYATRIGRDGRVLTPQPIRLAPPEPNGVSADSDPHVLWVRGHYLVFFVNLKGDVEVLRVTPQGVLVERVTLPVTIEWGSQFDVATDGDEIVLVSKSPKALRLGSNLQTIGTVDLFEPQYSFGGRSRGVAFGGGRFAIVTAYRATVLSQFLEGGVLTPPAEISEANIDTYDRRGVTRVAWTGRTFVAAWTECTDEDVCLGVWAPLTAGGDADGPIRSLGYSRVPGTYAYSYDITLTAVGEDTVFFTWRHEEDQRIALGRRYRLSGAPVGEAANFGTGPLASVSTREGALAVFDSRRRLAWVESAATATLPANVPLVATVQAPAAESVAAVAASASEIAVVRHVSSETALRMELAIASHDGVVRSTIPLADAYSVAAASDGEQFYLISNGWLAPVNFFAVESGKTVELSRLGWVSGLVWTGEEFLALWGESSRAFLARLDRNGRLLAMPRTFAAYDIVSFVAQRGRVLLAVYTGKAIEVSELDAHGNPIGAPEVLTGLNPYGGFALATDGEQDGLASVTSDFSDLVLAFRPRNGVFVNTPFTPEPPPPSRMTNDSVAIAGTRHGFVAAFLPYSPVAASPQIALLDSSGHAESSFTLPAGTRIPTLLTLTPDRVLVVYARPVREPAYAGNSRVFVRSLFIEDTASGVVGERQRRE